MDRFLVQFQTDVTAAEVTAHLKEKWQGVRVQPAPQKGSKPESGPEVLSLKEGLPAQPMAFPTRAVSTPRTLTLTDEQKSDVVLVAKEALPGWDVKVANGVCATTNRPHSFLIVGRDAFTFDISADGFTCLDAQERDSHELFTNVSAVRDAGARGAVFLIQPDQKDGMYMAALAGAFF